MNISDIIDRLHDSQTLDDIINGKLVGYTEELGDDGKPDGQRIGGYREDEGHPEIERLFHERTSIFEKIGLMFKAVFYYVKNLAGDLWEKVTGVAHTLRARIDPKGAEASEAAEAQKTLWELDAELNKVKTEAAVAVKAETNKLTADIAAMEKKVKKLEKAVVAGNMPDEAKEAVQKARTQLNHAEEETVPAMLWEDNTRMAGEWKADETGSAAEKLRAAKHAQDKVISAVIKAQEASDQVEAAKKLDADAQVKAAKDKSDADLQMAEAKKVAKQAILDTRVAIADMRDAIKYNVPNIRWETNDLSELQNTIGDAEKAVGKDEADMIAKAEAKVAMDPHVKVEMKKLQALANSNEEKEFEKQHANQQGQALIEAEKAVIDAVADSLKAQGITDAPKGEQWLAHKANDASPVTNMEAFKFEAAFIDAALAPSATPPNQPQTGHTQSP